MGCMVLLLLASPYHHFVSFLHSSLWVWSYATSGFTVDIEWEATVFGHIPVGKGLCFPLIFRDQSYLKNTSLFWTVPSKMGRHRLCKVSLLSLRYSFLLQTDKSKYSLGKTIDKTFLVWPSRCILKEFVKSSVSLYFTSLQGDQKKKGTDDALPTGISMFHEWLSQCQHEVPFKGLYKCWWLIIAVT